MSALATLFLRDIVAMAAAFTLPPYMASWIVKKWGLTKSSSERVAQMLCPVLMQFIGVPIHLLALGLYN